MALKVLKPITPGTRNTVLIDRSGLSKARPFHKLVGTNKKNGEEIIKEK